MQTKTNTKKTTFIFAFVILLMSGTLSLQGSTPENSLLWRISGNGLAQPSYLFGTHHLVPISFLDGIYGLSEAFESTEQTVGELDMRNMAEMQMQMMQRAMMPQGITYESLLSADDIALLDSKLTSLMGVGLAQFGVMRPAMLSNLITIMLYQRYYPEMASGQSIDAYFQEKALMRSRPVRALETAEDQLNALLETTSIERQAELLMCLVRHPEMVREQLHRLHAMYYAFDINGLYASMREENENTPCPNTDEEIDAMTKNRPLRCIDQLSAIINEKSSFIAVGALHLPGEYGLIEGLRRRGYTVEAVIN
jgi:uncharacterized protein YbaP (TraB family)